MGNDRKEAYDGFYNRFGKRMIDILLVIPILLLMLPFYVLIAQAILISDGSPVFYRPIRCGYKKRPFRITKFRTMVKNADQIGGGTTALGDTRITKIGRFLRKTKLDETSNLINVLKGDMSFVGPRPELLKYTDQYSGDELKIFEVRPGITDYSSLEFFNLDQIVGEKDADEMYEKKVLEKKNLLRIKYAETVSFRTDSSLFFRTIGRTFHSFADLIRIKRN